METDLERAAGWLCDTIKEENDSLHVTKEEIIAASASIKTFDKYMEQFSYQFPLSTSAWLPNCVFYASNEVRRAIDGEMLNADRLAPYWQAMARGADGTELNAIYKAMYEEDDDD